MPLAAEKSEVHSAACLPTKLQPAHQPSILTLCLPQTWNRNTRSCARYCDPLPQFPCPNSHVFCCVETSSAEKEAQYSFREGSSYKLSIALEKETQYSCREGSSASSAEKEAQYSCRKKMGMVEMGFKPNVQPVNVYVGIVHEWWAYLS